MIWDFVEHCKRAQFVICHVLEVCKENSKNEFAIYPSLGFVENCKHSFQFILVWGFIENILEAIFQAGQLE